MFNKRSLKCWFPRKNDWFIKYFTGQVIGQIFGCCPATLWRHTNNYDVRKVRDSPCVGSRKVTAANKISGQCKWNKHVVACSPRQYHGLCNPQYAALRPRPDHSFTGVLWRHTNRMPPVGKDQITSISGDKISLAFVIGNIRIMSTMVHGMLINYINIM